MGAQLPDTRHTLVGAAPLEALSQWRPFAHTPSRTSSATAPGLTSGMGSERRLQSFSWALSRTPHHRAESKFCQMRPKQMATHWRSSGWGSLSCSRQMAIRFPCRQASCRAEDSVGHVPRAPEGRGQGHGPHLSEISVCPS